MDVKDFGNVIVDFDMQDIKRNSRRKDKTRNHRATRSTKKHCEHTIYNNSQYITDDSYDTVLDLQNYINIMTLHQSTESGGALLFPHQPLAIGKNSHTTTKE